MSSPRGFTLIELLLVISIIALISSVVLTSFETGRQKARDAAIKHQLTEMRTLMYREFSDTGSYTNLKGNSVSGHVLETSSCPTVGSTNFTSVYAPNFRNGCLGIKTTLKNDCGTGNVCVTFYRPTGGGVSERSFSIAAYLPYRSRVAGGDRFFCAGSSGRTSIDDTALNDPGCPNNP